MTVILNGFFTNSRVCSCDRKSISSKSFKTYVSYDIIYKNE